MVIPSLATGLPQLGHHDGAAAGMEVTRAFILTVTSSLITNWSTEGALVSSSVCSLDPDSHGKIKQPINCAGGEAANCGICDLASQSQSPLGPKNLAGVAPYAHRYTLALSLNSSHLMLLICPELIYLLQVNSVPEFKPCCRVEVGSRQNWEGRASHSLYGIRLVSHSLLGGLESGPVSLFPLAGLTEDAILVCFLKKLSNLGLCDSWMLLGWFSRGLQCVNTFAPAGCWSWHTCVKVSNGSSIKFAVAMLTVLRSSALTIGSVQ